MKWITFDSKEARFEIREAPLAPRRLLGDRVEAKFIGNPAYFATVDAGLPRRLWKVDVEFAGELVGYVAGCRQWELFYRLNVGDPMVFRFVPVEIRSRTWNMLVVNDYRLGRMFELIKVE